MFMVFFFIYHLGRIFNGLVTGIIVVCNRSIITHKGLFCFAQLCTVFPAQIGEAPCLNFFGVRCSLKGAAAVWFVEI